MLTELQEKLAEAHGLAIAAASVTRQVAELTSDRDLTLELYSLRRDADETRGRCLALEQAFGATLADELLAHAITTKEKAGDLAGAWFKAGTGPLAAWNFLAMGEAAEVAIWSALLVLASKAGAPDMVELAGWALPVQRRHLATALSGVVQLAEMRDPTGPRWG